MERPEVDENENETADENVDYTPIDIPEHVLGSDDAQGFGQLEEGDASARNAILDAVFGEVSSEDLASLADDVSAEILLLNDNRTPENVDRMEALSDYLDAIEAEDGRRTEQQSQLDERAEARAERARRRAEGEADAGDTVVDEPILEGGDAPTGADAPVVDAPAAEPLQPVGAPAPAVAAATVLPPAPKPSGSGLAAALKRNQSRRLNAAARVPSGTEIAPSAEVLAHELLGIQGREEASPFKALKAATGSPWTQADIEEGDELNLETLAEAVWAKRKELHNKMGDVKDDRISLARATIVFPEDKRLTPDAQMNFGVFSLLEQHIETIVASGGNCAPGAPRYEINQYAVPMSPMEDNLPVLGAPRGAIRYVRALDFTELRSGVGVTTNEEDANPEGYGDESGQTDFKPCVHVDCPEVLDAVVTAVSTCIEFGNLTFETWPEFVAVRLRDLAANFASVKEVFYLDKIDADATLSVETCVYGAYRGLMRHVDKERWNYLKRHNMDVDATLDWYAPDVLIPMIRQDIIESNDPINDGAPLTAAEITSRFSALGLNVVWYYDSATGEGQAFSSQLAAGLDEDDDDFDEEGPSNEFPSDIVWYMEAPGTHVRLDSGTLDLGVVRDHILNRTNDLQIFAEQFIQVVMFGSQTVKGVTQDVCVNGAAPNFASLHTC